jgi:hypothetical protein
VCISHAPVRCVVVLVVEGCGELCAELIESAVRFQSDTLRHYALKLVHVLTHYSLMYAYTL